VASPKQLVALIRQKQPGDQASVTVRRAGTSFSRQMVLAAKWRESAEIGSMLYGLFNYGLYAARAGQPGLTLEAATALSDLAHTYPAALNEKIFKKYAALLQALAAAQQGDRDKGFNRLLETGLTNHQKKYIRKMPRVFAPFYKEREKLAYILETEAADLPAAPRSFRTPRSYPALSGRMIRPPEAPGLKKRPDKTPPSSQVAPRDTGGAVILE